jgi:transcriptional regulator with XRE-family HTH domain
VVNGDGAVACHEGFDMTPEQCRAARAWLDWSQDELAAAAGVSRPTVSEFEKGRRFPIANNLGALRAAFETQGIGFPFAVGDGESYACGITYSLPEKTPVMRASTHSRARDEIRQVGRSGAKPD